MTKRIVIKKGYIFCVEVEGKFKTYFQYVGTDRAELNSCVIRVFKRHYPMSYVPDMDEIISDEIDFHAHVYGLHTAGRDGLIYRVGKHSNMGDVENLWFRNFSELNYSHLKKSYRWYVWRINSDNRIFIGELTSEYRHLDWGMIFPFQKIYDRIRTGTWQVKTLE